MSLSLALLIAALLVAATLGAGLLLRQRQGHARTVHDSGMSLDGLLPDLRGESDARVYLVQFSTQLCARCPHTRRLLEDMASREADLEYVEIDLTRSPDLASRYRIAQTPTVFIVDAEHRIRHRIGGAPRLDELRGVLRSLREHVSPSPSMELP